VWFFCLEKAEPSRTRFIMVLCQIIGFGLSEGFEQTKSERSEAFKIVLSVDHPFKGITSRNPSSSAE
jgi:hypothetical protein